jgi:hypothetical protein
MAMKRMMNMRTKIVINNNIIEVNSFNCSEYTIRVSNNRDLEIKMNRFNQMCSTITGTLNNKSRRGRYMKLYKAMAGPALTYGSEI